jgi:hypothetical protein
MIGFSTPEGKIKMLKNILEVESLADSTYRDKIEKYISILEYQK